MAQTQQKYNAKQTIEKLPHQVIILDKSYFSFPRELQLIVKSLRAPILLATGLTKIRIVNELPSVSILVYQNEPGIEGMTVLLSPTVVSFATIQDILTSVDDHEKKISESFQPSENDQVIDWDHFFESLKLKANFPQGETFQVTFFNRNWQLWFGDGLPIVPEISDFIVAKVNKGSILDLDESKSRSTNRLHRIYGMKPVLDVCLPMLAYEIETFFKRHLFANWLSKPAYIELILPPSSFSENRLSIYCEGHPTTISTTPFPGFELFRTAQTSTGRRTSLSSNTNRTFRLEAMCRISTSRICNTLVFGNQTYLVSPIYEENGGISLNEKRLFGLASQMSANRSAILLSTFHLTDGSKLKGHFILLPSANGQLILKSIATSDLLVPLSYKVFRKVEKDEVDQVTLMEMESAVSRLKLEDKYDPTQVDCGLIASLESKAQKTKVKKKPDERTATRGTRGRGRGRGSF